MKNDIQTILTDHAKYWCKHHISGGLDSKCAVGLDIRKVTGGPDAGWGLRQPCNRKVMEINGVKIERVQCEKFELQSAEEIEADIKSFEEHEAKMEKALPLIKSLKERFRKLGGRGTEKCPGCGGDKLHWSVSSYNGHMRMCCETKDCINFIE